MKKATKLKAKARPKSKTKTRKLVKPKSKRKPKAALDIRRESFWAKEVAFLQGQTFRSFEHALEALLTSVLKRLGATKAEQAPMRDFLLVLLSTDPELTESLSKALKYKN